MRSSIYKQEEKLQIITAKVKVGDYKELEEMQITSEQYEAIGNGSKILCTVYLKNDKIVDVEFAEVHGRE